MVNKGKSNIYLQSYLNHLINHSENIDPQYDGARDKYFPKGMCT